jgi:hypothetical protein
MAIVPCRMTLLPPKFIHLGLAGGVALLLGACGGSHQEAIQPNEIAQLRAQVEALRQEIRSANGPPPSPEDRRAGLKAQEAANQLKFDGAPADPDLTRDAHVRFDPLIAAYAKAGRIECHRAFCRTETLHTSEANYRQFVRAAFEGTKAAWLGPYTVARVDSGAGMWTVVTFYGPETPAAQKIRDVFAKLPAGTELAPTPAPVRP